MIKLIIADDHAIVRAGIRRLLESDSDIEVLGEAGTGREAVALCEKCRPDVAVLDYDMPEMDGLDATREIISRYPGVRVLILTMFDSEEYAVRLIQAGALGFIIKGTNPDELLCAVKKVAEGKSYISPTLMEKVAFFRSQGDRENPISSLSDRELQVLVRLARGKVVREISDELSLSPSTVETYRRRILEKLDLRNVSDLTRFAIRFNLIDTY